MLTLLSKTGGARLKNVDTFICDRKSFVSLKSLDHKLQEEYGWFTNVLQGYMNKHKTDIVIKVYQNDCPFLIRELKALQHLHEYEHVVQYICHFNCMDRISKWTKLVQEQEHAKLCSKHGDSDVTFIVMEYVKNGELISVLDKRTINEVLDMFLQVALILLKLSYDYNYIHEDLNTGNILYEKTNKRKLTFNINNKRYNVKSNGVFVKIIDFGYSAINKHNDNDKWFLVLSQVHAAFISLSNYIGSDKTRMHLRKSIATYMSSLYEKTHVESTETFINDFRKFIKLANT